MPFPSPSVSSERFPVKLHACLHQLECEGLSKIVSFQPHGRCFVVHQKDEFVTQVLPRWFNQSKYSSFQRQLNIYGFNRATGGPDKDAYYHPLFLRGQQSLACNIGRIKCKGLGPRRPASADTEPNFYVMPPLEDGVNQGITSRNQGREDQGQWQLSGVHLTPPDTHQAMEFTSLLNSAFAQPSAASLHQHTINDASLVGLVLNEARQWQEVDRRHQLLQSILEERLAEQVAQERVQSQELVTQRRLVDSRNQAAAAAMAGHLDNSPTPTVANPESWSVLSAALAPSTGPFAQLSATSAPSVGTPSTRVLQQEPPPHPTSEWHQRLLLLQSLLPGADQRPDGTGL